MSTASEPSPPTAPSWRRWVRPVLLGVLLGWLVASGVTTLQARADLDVARAELRRAENRVRELDVAGAREATEAAVERLELADAAVDEPHLTPWRLVPVASRNLRVTRALVDEAHALAMSGTRLLERTDVVLAAATGESDGALPVDEVAGLTGPLEALADRADRAAAAVEALDSGALVGQVRGAFEQFTDQAREVASQASVAADATRLAADLLGAEEPRRLFVAAVTPAEIRGSGGVIGAWSVMELEDGRFTFDPFNRVFDLVQDSVGLEVEPPNDDYVDRWGQFDPLADWRNTTMTPDLPSAAVVMERLWEELNPSDPVDGVLLIDPTAFEVLARASGSALRLSNGLRVPADEVVDFVTNEAYVTLPDDRARREAIGEVATASLQQLLDQLGQDDVTRTLRQLADLFASGSTSLHVVDPELQETVLRLGIGAGLVDRFGDEIGLALNNGAGNKVDYWLEQAWDVAVRPTAGGGTTTQMTLRVHNGAPDEGFTEEVLGPFVDALGPGDTLLMTSVYCGPTCEFQSGPANDVTDRELGFGVNDRWTELESGEIVELDWEFSQEASWSFADGVYRHVVHVDVPATVQPPDVTVRVQLPATVVPVGLPPEARLAGDTVEWRPGRGTSTLVVTNAVDEAPPGLWDALTRPASSLW